MPPPFFQEKKTMEEYVSVGEEYCGFNGAKVSCDIFKQLPLHSQLPYTTAQSKKFFIYVILGAFVLFLVFKR